MLSVLMPSINELVTADYKSIKSAESERLINQALSGLYPVKHPELKQISGIPGAGKSTYCATYLPKNYAMISFDAIMLKLKGYQNALKASGAAYAYAQYEMPARIIGYELLKRAVMLRLNIMLEHSGVNEAHIELFQNLAKRGYKTSVDCVVCKTDIALSRTKERAAKINRYVPESVVLGRADKLREYMTRYQKIASTVIFVDGENNFAPLNKI